MLPSLQLDQIGDVVKRSKKAFEKNAKGACVKNLGFKNFGHLVVFGWKVPVFKVPGLSDQGAFGYYDDESKYVAIDASLDEKSVTHTLIHEMFHVCFDRLHVAPQIDDKFVEIIVENLAVAIMENFDVKRK